MTPENVSSQKFVIERCSAAGLMQLDLSGCYGLIGDRCNRLHYEYIEHTHTNTEAKMRPTVVILAGRSLRMRARRDLVNY